MLISELDFGSYLAYSPRGSSELAKKSRNILNLIKFEKNLQEPNIFMSEFVAKKMKGDISNLPFKDFFGPDVFLVPAPKSSLMKPNSLWASEKIAKALSKEGFGICFPCLERVTAVTKSATSKSEDRPKAKDHYDSLRVKSSIKVPKEIVIIDDVVTRGSTLLGCASRLHKAFPNIPIRGFAVVRTISEARKFKEISDACVGKITLSGNETFRHP